MAMLKWGQDTWIPLLLVGGYFRLLHRHDFTAGVCLGLAMTLKPYIFNPLVLVLLISRQKTIVLGVSISVGCAILLSFIVQGIHWPAEWLAVLQRDGRVAKVSSMPTIGAIFCRLVRKP